MTIMTLLIHKPDLTIDCFFRRPCHRHALVHKYRLSLSAGSSSYRCLGADRNLHNICNERKRRLLFLAMLLDQNVFASLSKFLVPPQKTQLSRDPPPYGIIYSLPVQT